MSSSDVHDVPALSVRQPWAELIVSGRKSVEVRSWPTAYRGKIWIHVPQRSDLEEERAFDLADLPKGQFVGSVTLCATVPLDRERWDLWHAKHLNLGEYRPANTLGCWIHQTVSKTPCLGAGNYTCFTLTLKRASCSSEPTWAN